MDILRKLTIYSQISSKDNAQIKFLNKLAGDARLRKQHAAAVIYGSHLVVEAARYNLIKQIFVAEHSLSSMLKLIASFELNDKVTIIDKQLLNKVNLLDSAIDCVAIITARYNFIPNLDIVNADCLIGEQIQDPGNLGTILRAAKASGIKNIILSQNSVDIYNPKVLRASQGIQFGLNIYCDIALDSFLANYQGQILAMLPKGGLSLYACDLTLPSALVLGNEGNGLSKGLTEKISQHLTIPMPGDAESLNLAMAASIAMFEMSRQRLQSNHHGKT